MPKITRVPSLVKGIGKPLPDRHAKNP